MKNEDLERLIKVLDGTDFKIENMDDVSVWVSLKDPWEGVEFVECTTDQALYFKRGKVYRLVPGANLGRGDCIYTEDGEKGSCLGIGGTEKNFKPSTIDAYVEQLKAKAFELYGEIKEQDKFEEPSGRVWVLTNVFKTSGNKEWKYNKDIDCLMHYSLVVYQQGQWAKKLPKRIEISDLNCTWIWTEESYKKVLEIGIEVVKEHMTKQLEEYLNK